MASSSSNKQQIRPRYVDLAEVDDTGDAENAFSSWPPAATVVRRPPPSIKTSRSNQPEPAVQTGTVQGFPLDSIDASMDKRQNTAPKTVRFESAAMTPTDDHQQRSPKPPSQESNPSSDYAATAASVPATVSIVGTVQERPKGRKPQSRDTAPKPRASRFVVARQMDEDLRQHDQEKLKEKSFRSPQLRQVSDKGFPTVARRDHTDLYLPPASPPISNTEALSKDVHSVTLPRGDDIATCSPHFSTQEEWLDEDGRPMSAFRKSRLLRQGLRPPSVRSIHEEDGDEPTHVPDPTRDPGGGADIDAISAVLAEVSRENTLKLQKMSSSEITEEVSDLVTLFGKNVLEALKSRKKPNSVPTESMLASERTVSDRRESECQDPTGNSGDPEHIRRQYFPTEPRGARPDLEWMLPQTNSLHDKTELRFDFKGVLLETSDQTDESYLSGLHHHGDNQSAPGYTFSELLHLARSSVAAQRQLALNLLGRICERHPTFPTSGIPAISKVTDFLNSIDLLPRAKVIMLARWLLDDRNFSVRSAALRCLASVLRSIPSGLDPVIGVNLELDWRKVNDTEEVSAGDQVDASDVDRSIQIDWASTMLNSSIMPLFLDQTDSLITSVWEAELALEIIYRIATCSSSHAQRIFGKDPKQVCDFVIHLGLQVTWPPVQRGKEHIQRGSFDAAPSLWALRILHVGILADRMLAQSIALNGTMDHLLRFIASPPWKEEAEQSDMVTTYIVPHSYEVFDAVLRMYISLAAYGMYATLVGRTWELWQEGGSWAVSLLKDVHDDTMAVKNPALMAVKLKVAQSLFELLAAWTHCSQDPHQLMGYHDVTWTQVRDWINIIEDVPSLLTAEGFQIDRSQRHNLNITGMLGAMCHFTTTWLDCALQKEPSVIIKKAANCCRLLAESKPLLSSNLRSALRRLSADPLLSDVQDVEAAVQSLQSLLRLSEVLNRVGDSLNEADLFSDASAGPQEITSIDVALLIRCDSLWKALETGKASFTGVSAIRELLTPFIASNIKSVVTTPKICIYNLVAVSRLDSVYRDLVAHVLLRSSTYLGGEHASHVLKPFILDCAGSSGGISKTDVVPALSEISTLCRPTPSKPGSVQTLRDKAGESIEKDEQNDDHDDLDPITGSKLWRCPASGLPLRADWPLLALDDLLHSANTAVFNRHDNLEADWQANELDIVRASLNLTIKMLDCQLKLCSSSRTDEDFSAESWAALSRLPSAEQVLLGVMKVFMLEKDQPDTFVDKRIGGNHQQQQSGALTGRDLFRDATVSSFLSLLLDLADLLIEKRRQMAPAVMSTITLETWTAKTIGSGMSFYQFFTDLVGLYDSISFGDRNFARVIMTVANAGGQDGLFEGKAGIAKDFRSLVWNDYRDSLQSMPDAPCPDWILGWFDKDPDMLELYARFLVSVASPSPTRKSIAYTLAIHHLRPIVQGLTSTIENHNFRCRNMVKSLSEACGPHILRDLLSPARSSLASSESKEHSAQSLNHNAVVEAQLDRLNTALDVKLSF